MNLTFVKKHTAGGTAGLEWKAGEVLAVNPYLASELVRLSPTDFQVVQSMEETPVVETIKEETIVENDTDSTDDNKETKAETEAEETKVPEKAARATKRAKATSA